MISFHQESKTNFVIKLKLVHTFLYYLTNIVISLLVYLTLYCTHFPSAPLCLFNLFTLNLKCSFVGNPFTISFNIKKSTASSIKVAYISCFNHFCFIKWLTKSQFPNKNIHISENLWSNIFVADSR